MNNIVTRHTTENVLPLIQNGSIINISSNHITTGPAAAGSVEGAQERAEKMIEVLRETNTDINVGYLVYPEPQDERMHILLFDEQNQHAVWGAHAYAQEKSRGPAADEPVQNVSSLGYVPEDPTLNF